ncbi:capsule biosynthesis protein [Sphingobium sp. DEHP117]|uniref:capsular polysaccharide export protein, LipB/KpsS family n=1 Tax=Sphingobium sp. DEHP117 TaxID=2993436 RepID=UPI0027D4BAD1|nr:capsule biosynthesis protein [Sphingobium sp. DEHP117]MDQ4420049.1 capsule biosynthesis protein [Sphingobium sp. DEHP117]
MTDLRVTEPLLRIPPFPGARVKAFTSTGPGLASGLSSVTEILKLMRNARIGGTFWGAQPELPQGDYLLVRTRDTQMRAEALGQAAGPVVIWAQEEQRGDTLDDSVTLVVGAADPWHMLSRARMVWTDADDETAFIAALMHVPLGFSRAAGRFTALGRSDPQALEQIATRELARAWADPFTGAATGVDRIILYCAEWRRLIDTNRPVMAAFGFGHWKQGTVDALLWGGNSAHTPFLAPRREQLDALPADAAVALWKARVPESFLAACEQSGRPLYEVEDGFIRSVGLGADCVPPLSIVVDPVGVHYDPARPSELENLLIDRNFAPDLLVRARQLCTLIIESGISKYEAGGVAPLPRPGGARRHILVTGQVEDDRSVMAGGGDVQGNFDLLARARAVEPDAFILYKPHPDVLSGHRKGHVAHSDALRHADAVVTDQPISTLLDMVDGVHVLTSLAGFEGLLRGKDVTTHGVPFYAGWGLTTDLGEVPERRRGHKRTLDELVAATLLLYPRYLDPITGLPCPPEVLIKRLKSGGARRKNTILVSLRRAQGKMRRWLSGVKTAS